MAPLLPVTAGADSISPTGKRVVFVHVPKTGGTTVTSVLSQLFGESRQRARHEKLREMIIDDSAFVFAFVRNPWDRLLSAWSMKQGRAESFSAFIQAVSDGRMGMSTKPQSDWLEDDTGRLAVDHIGRFESFEKDLAAFLDELGYPPGSYSIPRLNSSAHPHYREMYSEADRRIVERIYARDIEMFGYRYEAQP